MGAINVQCESLAKWTELAWKCMRSEKTRSDTGDRIILIDARRESQFVRMSHPHRVDAGNAARIDGGYSGCLPINYERERERCTMRIYISRGFSAPVTRGAQCIVGRTQFMSKILVQCTMYSTVYCPGWCNYDSKGDCPIDVGNKAMFNIGNPLFEIIQINIV